ncbi:MAG TPA: DPP IV N-terminal domain-containing protein, partial [Pyrinomonadaceae bacterium]|nr:DPP IV N-terminal domain-containing protein [Pyrinomonadaceae bacterium]
MSDRSGAQNIWVLPRGGQAKQLTKFTDGRVLWPTLSYDGNEITFERNFHIWKMNADSGKAQELSIALRGAASTPMTDRVALAGQIRDLALSPDGKKVAVIARGEVFAASASDGGDAVRVTNTPAAESFVTWSTDSRKLIYASERNGSSELYQYDFATETETPITQGKNIDASPVFSPDGKSLAFVRNSRTVMVYDMQSKTEREVTKIYTDPEPLLGGDSLRWSPDGKWIAFLTYSPETRSYTNVSVAPAAGGAARPISFLANANAGSLDWAPDGSYILFSTSQRTEDSEIARIDLKLRTPRFREDQFRDLFKEENPRQRPTQPGPSPASSPAVTPSATEKTAEPSTDKKAETKATEIVFDDIRRRLSFLNTGLNSNGGVISPDGKTLVMLASAEGQFNLYTMPLDELATDQSAKQLTSTQGFKSQPQFSPDGKSVYYLENGRINIVSLDRREVRPLNVNMEMTVDLAKEKLEVFKQGWRFLRDNFFDEKFNGVDWENVRAT